MAADKIKCSYDDCFKHFKTLEAMKKHKTKDESHDYYCKRCDEDCTNDTELLYHQITSTKHVACPVCGREFKSEAGRDRHVEIEHVPKQSINCVGCGKHFDRASALMRHIEQSECEVIKQEHFQRQRAEKQISKDAWLAVTDPVAGTTIVSSNTAYVPAQPDLTLLDDERAFVSRNWQGLPEFDPDNEENGPYVGRALEEQLMRLAIDRYPALGSRSQGSADQASQSSVSSRNLLDDNQASSARTPIKKPSNPWSQSDNTSQLFPGQVRLPSSTLSQDSTNLLDNFKDEDDSRVTWGSRNEHHTDRTANIQKRVAFADSNPNAHIQTVQQIPIPSSINISRFWDPLQENYACPGRTCGLRFPDIESFKAHLLRGAHVVPQVTCHACLKHFKTTTALIAHCESGSRKCKVGNAVDYDMMIREVTAGLLATDGMLADGSVRYGAVEIQDW